MLVGQRQLAPVGYLPRSAQCLYNFYDAQSISECVGGMLQEER